MATASKNPTDRLKKIITRQRLQTVFTVALGGLLLFQMVQFYQFREKLAFLDDLYDRNTMVLSDLNKSKDFLTGFGADLNEIRQFLLLPTKDYDFGGIDEIELASEGESLSAELFDFVGTLGKYEKNQVLYNANLAALKVDLNSELWAQYGLVLVDLEGRVEDEGLRFDFKDTDSDAVLLSVELGYNGLLSVPLYYREVDVTDRSSWPAVFKDIQAFLADDLGALRTSIAEVNAQRGVLKSLVNSTEVQAVFREKQMVLSQEQESEEQYFYELRNSQLMTLGVFSVAKQNAALAFEDLDLDGSVSEQLLVALRELDARTDQQKQLDARIAELEATFNDRAFEATLEKLKLHFGPSVETGTQIQYPLLNEAGETLRIIFVDKASAEVKVMLPDGTAVQSLSMATEALTTSKKKL